jgi:hypothetical protein
MTEEQLDLIEFVRREEVASWKIVTFNHNNVHALRSCGRAEKFKGSDDASKFVMNRGIHAAMTQAFKLTLEPAQCN